MQAWQSGRFEIVAPPALLAELEAVASRPRLTERMGNTGRALVDLLQATAILHDDQPAERAVPGDPQDDYLVALARTAGARVIVTGDRHLLELEDLRPPALEPATFLALLDRMP